MSPHGHLAPFSILSGLFPELGALCFPAIDIRSPQLRVTVFPVFSVTYLGQRFIPARPGLRPHRPAGVAGVQARLGPDRRTSRPELRVFRRGDSLAA